MKRLCLILLFVSTCGFAANAQKTCGASSFSGSVDPSESPSKQGMSPEDAALYKEVRGAMRSQFACQFDNIYIDVYQGTVILKGGVYTEKDKETLENAIRAVPGVVKLDSKLTVRK